MVGADLLPKPGHGRLPIGVTGGSQQSPKWIAAHADFWLTYPRAPQVQAPVLGDWRGIDLLRYPHIGLWIKGHAIEMRLNQEINPSLVSIVYTGFHWCALPGSNPLPVLRNVLPYLRQIRLDLIVGCASCSASRRLSA